eukprot:scaffold7017_cov113-Isochrysis_galbana.AAC.4
MAQGYMAWRGDTAGRAVAARTAWRPASDAIEGDEVAVYETSSYERPTDGPGPAPTDGAGVLSSVTGPRGAGDAIASDMRQSDKQRATKDLWRLKGDTKCGHGKHGGTPQRRSEGER